MDDRPPAPPPPSTPEAFVTRERARRFAWRLTEVARERATYYKGAAIGMTSFAEAVPALLAIEEDMASSIDGVLGGRLRDRERGETEIPFVVALEGALERTSWARRVEEGRRDAKLPAAWAEKRLLALLADAARRLDAFGAVYDAKRILPVPAPAELSWILLRVEEDASLERLGTVATQRMGLVGPPADRPVPALVTAPDALEDLLRAARAEVPAAPPPWRVRRASPTAPVELSIGVGAEDAREESTLVPSPAAARTSRAASVLRFAQVSSVARARSEAGTLQEDGEVIGVRVTLADATAVAVGSRVAPDVALPPAADAAVRAYVVAASKVEDPLDPTRLVATMGVFRAVEQELSRVLKPALETGSSRVVAGRVPRESSRKAPVHREVLATLAAAVAGFPDHRATEVLDGIAEGKPPPTATKPPDAAVVLAVLGRRWPGSKSFGDRVLPLGSWTDDDVMASVREVVDLAAIRTALERGKDPGPGFAARFEAAAFGLLSRLSRLSSS